MTSALEAAEQAVKLHPGDAGVWYQLGLARLDSGLLNESESCWRKVLALDPRHAKASVNLGLVLQSAGRGQEALEQYRSAVAVDPGLGQAWFNLGTLLLERHRPVDAMEALRAAVKLDAGRPDWHAALGSALGECGLALEAVRSLRGALQADPAMHRAHSELLQLLNRLPGLSPQAIYEEHLSWASRHAGPRDRGHKNSRDAARRLKVGYVSADFMEPAISLCLQPVLAWHDAPKFEVFCYSDAPPEDPASWRLRARNVAWRSTAHMSDQELADAVREDGIDILVDLAGHSGGGRRMLLFASAPAPVQVSLLGYPCTTGLEAIDYRISDRYLAPDGAQQHYTERLVRLPGPQWCFTAPFDAPQVNSLPARQEDGITFGALRELATMTPDAIALWAQVLRRVRGSRLIVAAPDAAKTLVDERFASAGLDPARIEVHGDFSEASRLSLHGRIDISLDAFPASGAHSALHSLWMGVPVVTLEGPTPASRQTAEILREVGLGELIARSADGYAGVAAALASNRDHLSRLRGELRGRLERSTLADAERYTRGLEDAYRRMWQAWCDQGPVQAFDVRLPEGASRNTVPRPRRNATNTRPPKVVLDGVFFQDYHTGISRVWQSLLQVWVAGGFAARIVLLDRQGTAPPIPGVRRRVVPRHAYDRLEEDRAMLQRVCEEEGASVFASTYYSAPLETPSVMMVYDMIAEMFGSGLDEPMWLEKDACIRQARRFVAISRSTARDLCCFYPQIRPEQVAIAHCGVSPLFRPAQNPEIEEFKRRYAITRPYFLVVGSRNTYKNVETFVRVFARSPQRRRLAVVCVGGGQKLSDEFLALQDGSERHLLQLDDHELRLAYCGAVALVYPSFYEGFGMPVAEAMASGCPVITTASASLPEVAGDAAIYVRPMDEAALNDALERVQDPALRESLVAKGLEQARGFSWTKMANIVEAVLTETGSS